MNLFSNDIRVVDTSTPNNFTVTNYTGPNVSQFGWTKADQGNYNQLIQYVEECRQISDYVKDVADYITEVEGRLENVDDMYQDIVFLYHLI